MEFFSRRHLLQVSVIFLLTFVYSTLAQRHKTTKRPGSSVDNDPHFIVQVKGSSHPVCFDVTGKDGDIYQLISDPAKDIYVNGRIFGANVTKNGRTEYRTYFGGITVIKKDLKITITSNKIKVMGNKGRHPMRVPWKEVMQPKLVGKDVWLSVRRQHNVTVDIGHDIVVAIVKHRHKKMGLRFLGVYLMIGQGLSADVGGLIGEFQYKEAQEQIHSNKLQASLHVKTSNGPREVPVKLGSRLNLAQKVRVTCWQVADDHIGVLDHAHDAYLVPYMTSKQRAWGGTYLYGF